MGWKSYKQGVVALVPQSFTEETIETSNPQIHTNEAQIDSN